tara:strand:- start:2572 stop:3714 length:1143 start_codon:yes stop_codon:yes gene_type:complete
MNFFIDRKESLEKLNRFVENNLQEYSKLRNFDFGPQKRENTSTLSPFVSHGVINEAEIINKVLKKYLFKNSEKFIQEIFWRIYWKGWLELRPKVWEDYLLDLEELKEKYKNNLDLINAVSGKTNIKCFNEWVKELEETGYLHNHTRMWFASIWIFTLKLPWELGAEFFLKNLYDGDVASNTLGWRWVAGVQTPGKHYLASEWNIKKFTNNRFNNIELNDTATPIPSEKKYFAKEKNIANPRIENNKILIIFDNNLSFEASDFNKFKFQKIFLVNNEKKRKILLNSNVIKLKNFFLNDQLERLKEKSINCEIIDINDIKNLKEDVYCLYPQIGENLDFIYKNKINSIKFLYRKIDQISWKFCNKGFFNFKNYIPKIIESIS